MTAESTFQHRVTSVDVYNPADRKKLADHIAKTYAGSLLKWDVQTLADAMALCTDGTLYGQFGGLQWTHESGGAEFTDVRYTWLV